ncbi:glycosyltransferase family 9 protein [Leucobacter massiliensis]|uniref:Glycosyl transferase n=1 Tax=Leucobacter massiliensis TaxID=1686285 RepID=A0A2S9QKA3_9MICO|nr:glycosyltransferase family 9 protein [Leucobacter massiliensis]PRI10017.1 glycosyl transferase [Leucobacter massiliensis]
MEELRRDDRGIGDGRPVLLALRALKLGDLLVAVPALRGLRRAFPRHRLVLAAPSWLAPVARLIPAVDALWPTPDPFQPLGIPAGQVDVAVNLHGSGPQSRARIAELGARLRIVHRAEGDPRGPEWIEDLHERERWVRLVRAYGVAADPLELTIDRPDAAAPVAGAVVVHVGAAFGSRHWPVERFAAVVRGLRDAGHEVVLTGGRDDAERARAVAGAAGLPQSRQLAGCLSLDAFAAQIAGASLLVSVDTGAAHLASAYRVPSAIVFGPSPPERWGPPPGPHRVLTEASLRRGEAFASDPDPALLAVSAAQLLDAARSLLSGDPAPTAGAGTATAGAGSAQPGGGPRPPVS